ncbi:MAG: hypothetical protein DMF68_07655 [Acidobacteria bacterium]|nr:MAG: hypothetical protein DMF68_07655 [Acidobacteriota bacterium]
MRALMQSSPPNQFIDTEGSGRRQAPRCDAELNISLRLSSPWYEAEKGARETPQIMGTTQNLSETGLAVSLPSNRIGGRYLNIVGSTLHLTLNLPTGPIEMYATPKWCKWLLDDKTTNSYHLGLRIIEMSDEEWVRLVRYVHACL